MSGDPLSFADFLEEVIDFILKDDRDSRDTDDGRAYYIMGFDAYCWDRSNIETKERRENWSPRPSSDKYVRAIIAADKKDYLKIAHEASKCGDSR